MTSFCVTDFYNLQFILVLPFSIPPASFPFSLTSTFHPQLPAMTSLPTIHPPSSSPNHPTYNCVWRADPPKGRGHAPPTAGQVSPNTGRRPVPTPAGLSVPWTDSIVLVSGPLMTSHLRYLLIFVLSSLPSG